jgi:hypothetical protein
MENKIEIELKGAFDVKLDNFCFEYKDDCPTLFFEAELLKPRDFKIVVVFYFQGRISGIENIYFENTSPNWSVVSAYMLDEVIVDKAIIYQEG